MTAEELQRGCGGIRGVLAGPRVQQSRRYFVLGNETLGAKPVPCEVPRVSRSLVRRPARPGPDRVHRNPDCQTDQSRTPGGSVGESAHARQSRLGVDRKRERATVAVPFGPIAG